MLLPAQITSTSETHASTPKSVKIMLKVTIMAILFMMQCLYYIAISKKILLTKKYPIFNPTRFKNFMISKVKVKEDCVS